MNRSRNEVPRGQFVVGDRGKMAEDGTVNGVIPEHDSVAMRMVNRINRNNTPSLGEYGIDNVVEFFARIDAAVNDKDSTLDRE